jgi:hypothetical protein
MSSRTTVDPPTFWLEPSPGAVGEGVPVPPPPPPFVGEGLPVPPGTVGEGEGERAGGTEKGSRPVKLWMGGPPPPGDGLGEVGGSGVSGIGGSGSSPPPRKENSRKPARSTPTTMPPIVTVRRSR